MDKGLDRQTDEGLDRLTKGWTSGLPNKGLDGIGSFWQLFLFGSIMNIIIFTLLTVPGFGPCQFGPPPGHMAALQSGKAQVP